MSNHPAPTPATARAYPRAIVGRFTDVTPDPAEVDRLSRVPRRDILSSAIAPNPRQRFYAQRNVNIMGALSAFRGCNNSTGVIGGVPVGDFRV